MPLQKLQFRPGVNREGTTLSNEGGWYDCDKVRFRSGYPEKIGGWAANGYNTFLGVCRSLWNWITLKQYNLLGLGTNLKFYVEDGQIYYDITPLRETNGNLAGQITLAVTNNSNVLTITDAGADGLQVGDFVTLAGAVTLGGNVTAGVLNQEYQISSVLSGTQYTVTLRQASTSINGVKFITDPLTSVFTLPPDVTTVIANGDAVVLLPTIALPSGLSAGTTYYLVNVPLPPLAANTFQLSLTPGGPPVTVTTPGLGQQAFYFTLVANTNASSSAMTALTIAYQINTGFPIYTVGTGWGAGSWSRGAWNSGFTTGFGIQLRLWSQMNFGEYLIFNPRGGALYIWQPGSGATPGYSVRGVVLSPSSVTPAGWTSTVTDSSCPTICNQIMVSDSTRIVIAFGCNDYGSSVLDPLLIRWSAQESFSEWAVSATNQAGSYRLSHGSEIVSAIQTRQEIIVLTDAAIYSMQYLGPPFVWGFTLLADNISIMSPNAVATATGVVFWMGTDKFYVYSGRVETLPCAVRQYVFNDINRTQEAQFLSGTNEGYSEVWWFYCSSDSDVIDRYVIFNYLDRVWYYGTMDRTAWLDSALRQFPQAATGNNIVVFHEAAVDDGSTNPPSAIDSYVQSSDFDIGDGHNYGFVNHMIPDITFDGSDVNAPQVIFTVRPRQNPGANYSLAASPPVVSANNYVGQQSYNVQQFTQIVYTRLRGRQMAFKVESNSIGTQWQLGVPRMDVRPDGRK